MKMPMTRIITMLVTAPNALLTREPRRPSEPIS
jgi:hypothetical protein